MKEIYWLGIRFTPSSTHYPVYPGPGTQYIYIPETWVTSSYNSAVSDTNLIIVKLHAALEIIITGHLNDKYIVQQHIL